MWSSPLIASCALGFLLTLWLVMPRENQCIVHITGESVRIIGCHLTPAHLREISKLKALNGRL
nr:MAG: triple gene block protein 3 [Cactus carlavirus 1]